MWNFSGRCTKSIFDFLGFLVWIKCCRYQECIVVFSKPGYLKNFKTVEKLIYTNLRNIWRMITHVLTLYNGTSLQASQNYSFCQAPKMLIDFLIPNILYNFLHITTTILWAAYMYKLWTTFYKFKIFPLMLIASITIGVYRLPLTYNIQL